MTREEARNELIEEGHIVDFSRMAGAALISERIARREAEARVWEARNAVLEQRERLITERIARREAEERAKKLGQALVKVRAHTPYQNPTLELLAGLLASIERIVDTTLEEPQT